MPFEQGKSGNPDGRPPGKTLKTKIKDAIKDYLSPDEVEELLKSAKEKAITNDRLHIFILEQVFGKARQNIGLDGGEEGKAISVEISKAIADKNGIDTKSEQDSE